MLDEERAEHTLVVGKHEVDVVDVSSSTHDELFQINRCVKKHTYST